MLHCHHLLSHCSAFPPFSPFSRYSPSTPCPPPHHLRSPIAGRKLVVRATGLQPSLAELLETTPSPLSQRGNAELLETTPSPLSQRGNDGGGPIEISPSSPSPIFAVDDNPSPLQVATSVLLTGAISVFLFRSLRRRAKRAKELRVRSTGVMKEKDVKEEALDRLKAMGVAPVEAGAPPSPIQALLGSIAAGVIAVILYKFTITVEASLNRQTISDNFSVRQITVTIRTIVNGLCYLATFVFGVNSIGLLLYSFQLFINSLMGDSTSNFTAGEKEDGPMNVIDPTISSTDIAESQTKEMQERSDDA